MGTAPTLAVWKFASCDGCQLSLLDCEDELLAIAGRKPDLPGHSVCFECKARGTTCITVARGVPCLGPVTRAGCGALCPAYGRGCFGCFGPAAVTNTPALVDRLRELDMTETDIGR